jgi:hypothetical protein
MGHVVLVYAGEEPPQEWNASLFVAGPMPRDPVSPSWRPEALREITAAWDVDGTLVVFLPEPRDRHRPPAGYVHQIWEDRWMSIVDVILFWVPRDMATMPGLTTNVEFGRYESSGRVVLATPPEAHSVRYLRHFAQEHGAPVADSLESGVRAAMKMIDGGAHRAGGERTVPLLVWRTASFQSWLADHRSSGRELLDARLVWTFGSGPRCWAVRATVLDSERADRQMVICQADGTTTCASL